MLKAVVENERIQVPTGREQLHRVDTPARDRDWAGE